jgi:2-phosphosulfolactate phosphatase
LTIDVYFTTGEVEPTAFQEATAVVIDVVRATTSMVEALANGAKGIFPTTSTEEAVKLASSLGREDTLLCGERKGIKIEGFDLGNSPSEYTPEVVGGKRLVMKTTNGTGAFAHAQEADRIFACSLTNLSAVAEALVGVERLVVQCAGRQDRFALEDAVCAGHLLKKLLGPKGGDAALNDGALASLALTKGIRLGRAFLARTWAGRSLDNIGLSADLKICADVDRHAIVPEMHDQALTVAR